MFTIKSNLLKFGYGYDISGEVQEGGGTSGQGKDINDTAQPWAQHTTSPSPVNVTRDSEAEEEFPELIHESNVFPSRGK